VNGIHDLGGMDGMGPIVIEAGEPVFHADWERRVFGLFFTTFAAGIFNIDEIRRAIELMAPADYLESSYYEHWLHALETLMVEKGVLAADELQRRRAELGAGSVQ
jgi:nitrile hydratase